MRYRINERVPSPVLAVVTRPKLRAVDVHTGEVFTSLADLTIPGGLLVFNRLDDALEDLAEFFVARGSVTLYGDVMAAGYWRIGRAGIRLAGLQGYDLKVDACEEIIDFWRFLERVCEGAKCYPGSTPGATSLRIAQALSPYRLDSPGDRTLDFVSWAYAGGAQHGTPGEYSSAYLYDIHAAYPSVMKLPLPFGEWRHYKSASALPDEGFYIARIKLDYQTTRPFSPLWLKDRDGQIYHPVESRDTSVILTGIDVETLRACGDLTVHSVRDVFVFKTVPLLLRMQDYLASYLSSANHYRSALKVLRVAAYGRFARRDEQETYILKAIDDPKKAVATKHLLRLYPGMKFGLFEYVGPAYGMRLPHIAAAITARVRSRIYRTMDDATIAIRTDSLLSTRKRDDLVFGESDGLWDAQDKGRAIVFGSSGFALNDKSHIDGVHRLAYVQGKYIGKAYKRDRQAFAKGSGGWEEWPVEMERKTTIKTAGDVIQVYHSPLAAEIKQAACPVF